MSRSMLGLALLALATASLPAEAEAPYPPSAAVTGIAWDVASLRSAGQGGDLWSVTSAAGGKVYTAWGDGAVTCPSKVSYGVAAIPSATPSAALAAAGCGPAGTGQGKIISLLAAGGALHAVAYLQDRKAGAGLVALWRSTDGGLSWQRPAWTFAGADLRPEEFVHFGPDNAGAPGGLVYLTLTRPDQPDRLYLGRVPRAKLLVRSAYTYLTSSTPETWGKDQALAVPVFADPAGVVGPVVTRVPALGRYLLTAGHGGGGDVGVFEAPTMWGPWRTVDYRSGWLGIGAGASYLGVSFPTAWIAADGRSLWAVLSCWNPPAKGVRADAGPCGAYNDRYNLMRATLTVAKKAGG